MSEQDSRIGLFYSVASAAVWGFMPLYWRLLGSVSPLEITIHRVLWCAVCVGILVTARGRLGSIIEALHDKRTLGTLLLTGLLISVNWSMGVWAVANERLVQMSLGYYISPLISIAIGVVLLGEKLTPFRRLAVVLAFIAVLVRTASLGEFPALALTLAFTFAFYGYLRKTVRMGSLDGVFVEAALLFPIMLGVVLYWGISGEGAFLARNPYTDFLLICSGAMTALPLVLFSAGARLVRLTTVGFLQYLAPTITLLLAVIAFGEPFTLAHAATFGCVWLALLLLAFERAPPRVRSLPVDQPKSGQRKSQWPPPVSPPPS